MKTGMSLYLPKNECTFMSRKLGSMNDYSCLLCVTQCKQTNVTVELLKRLTRHAPLTAFYTVAVKLYLLNKGHRNSTRKMTHTVQLQA